MKIDETKTWMPLGMFFSALIVACGGAWWMSAMYAKVVSHDASISSLQANHEEVVKELRNVNETLVEIKTVLKGK